MELNWDFRWGGVQTKKPSVGGGMDNYFLKPPNSRISKKACPQKNLEG